MQVSSLYKEVYHPKGNYSIRLLTTNNIEICRRKDWNQSQFNSCVYIFTTKNNKSLQLGWDIKIEGECFYFGFASKFDPEHLFNNRPFTHRKDLLASLINDEVRCYCILGLSEKEAHSLEALFIQQCNKSLTKRGSKILYASCIANKRYERKWERLANKYLNLETQWK